MIDPQMMITTVGAILAVGVVAIIAWWILMSWF